MSTSKPARMGRVCHTGYIMLGDLRPRCEVCLGPEHASPALTLGSHCPFCALLPPEEWRHRADSFAVQNEEVWRPTRSLDEALDLLLREEPELDGSTLPIHGSPIGSELSLFRPPMTQASTLRGYRGEIS